jgi:CelD/BcsL family acetyltransferase involved in cellulose biosynthesis
VTVEQVTTLKEFECLRGAYEDAYRGDPYRNVFVSWAWLRAFFAALRRPWMVLSVREGARYAGFCVLVESGLRLGPLPLYRELAIGAYPTADYASLIVSGDEEHVLSALAAEISRLSWDVFRACNVHDSRVARMVAMMRDGHDVVEEPRNAAHVVPLPASWSEYMVRLNGEKQYVARRHKLWRDAELLEANDANVELYIDTLLRLHNRRWNSNLNSAKRTYGRLFREAYDRGCCRIAVLWDGDRRPLAAQAAFVDNERRSWGVYMLAYDRERQKGSPGIGMLAKALERAIVEGYGEYDFLRGDESYKARFGTELRMLENFLVKRRSLRRRLAEWLWARALAAKAFLRRVIFGRTL